MLILFEVDFDVQTELAGVHGRLHEDAQAVEVEEAALEKRGALETKEQIVYRQEIVTLLLQSTLESYYSCLTIKAHLRVCIPGFSGSSIRAIALSVSPPNSEASEYSSSSR